MAEAGGVARGLRAAGRAGGTGEGAPKRAGATVTGLVCAKCGRKHRPDEARYTCRSCGLEGVLDVQYDYDAVAASFSREDLARSRENSLWRYLPLLPVGSAEAIPALKTGWTPLYDASGLLGLKRLFIKDDSRNPTASLKDRATAVAIARATEEKAGGGRRGLDRERRLLARGVRRGRGSAVLHLRPEDAPKPKVAQLLVYGATVFAVDGHVRRRVRSRRSRPSRRSGGTTAAAP